MLAQSKVAAVRFRLEALLVVGIVWLGFAAVVRAGDEIFADNFECGCTFQWSNELEDGPSISVVSSAGLEGQWAARFTMDGTQSFPGSHLSSIHPLAETAYRARFLARWASLGLPAGSHVALLRGYSSESGPTGKVFELRLQQPATGSPRLRLAVSDTSVEGELSRPVCLDASAAHELEVRWRSAGLEDRGTLQLLVGGAVAATLPGGLLADTTLDLVHFGTSYCRGASFTQCPDLITLPNPFFGASGSIDFDDFESFASFVSAPEPIFSHDFECGDLAGWSAIAP